MKLNTKALADVEIGIPIIAEGIYHARIDKVEIKSNKRGDGNNLVLQFKILDNPIFLYKDNKEIENRGQVVSTRYIGLVPSEKRDPNQDLKELAVAIKHPPESDLNESDLKDKLVMVKIGWKDKSKDEKSGKEYPAGNEVLRITPVPDEDHFTAPPF